MSSDTNNNHRKGENDSNNHSSNSHSNVNNNDDDDDLLLMNQLMDENDDDFISQEEIQRREADKRRFERKRRYEKLQLLTPIQQQQQQPKEIATTVTTNTSTIQQQQQQQDHELSNEIVEDKSYNNSNNNNSYNMMMVDRKKEASMNDVENTNQHNNQNDNEEEYEEDGIYDMFSASVSPIMDTTIADNNNHNNNNDDEKNRGIQKANEDNNSKNNNNKQQDWDDAEGYYKTVIGETIHLSSDASSSSTIVFEDDDEEERIQKKNDVSTEVGPTFSFRITGLIGKGVFSTVVKGMVIHNSTSIELPPIVALKLIRHNETMAKAALTELCILQKLNGSSGIIPLLLPSSSSSSNQSNNNNYNSSRTVLEYRGHVLLIFPYMEYNLRDVLQKFGKGVGLSLQAVRSYFGQLLAALIHLQKHNIIHSDLKPDNILVSADFGIVQIADFGSAFDISDSITGSSTSSSTGGVSELPTPYLVSRFYRAPEIILGLVPLTYMIDLWSLGVSIGELFLGDVLIKGTSNNDMLFIMQQYLGPFPNRIIRQHLVQCKKYTTQIIPAHFQQHQDNNTLLSVGGYYFTQRTVDPVAGIPVNKVISLSTTTHQEQQKDYSNNNTKYPFAHAKLHSKLMKAKSAKDSRRMVHLFSDLLHKCLSLDPTKRILLRDALRHEFFQQQQSTLTNTNATSKTTTTAVVTK